MNKRGMEDLVWVVILVLLVVSAAGFLFFWINAHATGDIIRAQVNAKSAAMLVDSAEPNTVILINNSTSIEKGKAVAKFGETQFEYSFFSPHKISSAQKGDNLEVRIE